MSFISFITPHVAYLNALFWSCHTPICIYVEHIIRTNIHTHASEGETYYLGGCDCEYGLECSSVRDCILFFIDKLISRFFDSSYVKQGEV